MRLVAIVDHRGRSATAIETSVFFVDSENTAAGMKYTISRPARATILIYSFLVSRVLQTITLPQTYVLRTCVVLLNKNVGKLFALIFVFCFL